MYCQIYGRNLVASSNKTTSFIMRALFWAIDIQTKVHNFSEDIFMRCGDTFYMKQTVVNFAHKAALLSWMLRFFFVLFHDKICNNSQRYLHRETIQLVVAFEARASMWWRSYKRPWEIANGKSHTPICNSSVFVGNIFSSSCPKKLAFSKV